MKLIWRIFGRTMAIGADGIARDKRGIKWVREEDLESIKELFEIHQTLFKHQMNDVIEIMNDTEGDDKLFRSELVKYLSFMGYELKPNS